MEDLVWMIISLRVIFVNKLDYEKFERQNTDSIIDVISIGNNYLISCKNTNVTLNTMLDNGNEKHNINISIASAITAYARIHMSQFKK